MVSKVHASSPAATGPKSCFRNALRGQAASGSRLLAKSHLAWGTAALSVLSALLLSACLHGGRTATQDALRRVKTGASDAPSLALAGFHALLVASDVQQAQAYFDAAIRQDASQPWAQYGLLHLAQRAGQPQRVLAHALHILKHAPRHPLARVAARVVLQLAGNALSTDAMLQEALPVLLAQGARGEVAPLLRAALAAVAERGPQTAPLLRLHKAAGVPTVATLVGPFSPWNYLSMADATKVETSGDFSGLGEGPYGPHALRMLHFLDGRVSLWGASRRGNLYLLGIDVRVAETATYVLRTVTPFRHLATLDGKRLITRLAMPAPSVSTRVLRLRAGVHRLVLRLFRPSQPQYFHMALHRLDGRPAGLHFAPARGPAPQGWAGAVETVDGAEGLYPSAEALYRALAWEAGDMLARVVAVQDALRWDTDGANALLAGLSPSSAAVSVLRAAAALQGSALPPRTARARAAQALEVALRRDATHPLALSMAAQLALKDGQKLKALQFLKRARTGASPPAVAVLLLEARAKLAVGLDAEAARHVREALKVFPGHCAALDLAFSIANAQHAVAQASALLEKARHCPRRLYSRAEYLQRQGRMAEAETTLKLLLRLRGTGVAQAAAALKLAALFRSQKRHLEALALLESQRVLWPRNMRLLKMLADMHDEVGHAPKALQLREALLSLRGDDLALRRLVQRAKTGRELLAAYAVGTREALEAYEASPGTTDASAVLVLDAAAVRVYADASAVARIHVIEKAMDQQGVQKIAEVWLPEDVVLLKLRTLKQDGSILEPESITGKDSISLPGVQVGDMVEYEYLQAYPSRGPGEAGFTAGAFYFQVAGKPNTHATYTVVAPKGMGMQADGHNMQAAQVLEVGELEVFHQEMHHVPPFIPETSSPPSEDEWLPFVSVGAGQTGHEGKVAAYADAVLPQAVATHEVRAFAQAAAGEAKGMQALRAVYAAVMDKLPGNDKGPSISAAASLAQGRGSRTMLLYAALRALGFEARLAAVRTFKANPASYRFPNPSLLTYICIRVLLPDGQSVWLDPYWRYAPFGVLPENALGGRQAYLFPEAGRPLEKVLTPARAPLVKKEVHMRLKLSTEGALSGSCAETYRGYDAVQLALTLESSSVAQHRQAWQKALAKHFHGANLSTLRFENSLEEDGTVSVRYQFTSDAFSRKEADGTFVLGALTHPQHLSHRYSSTSKRVTPLFIATSEAMHTVTTLTLPEGYQPKNLLPSSTLEGPASARFSRTEKFVRAGKRKEAVLTIEEDLHVRQARVMPQQYEDFVSFVGDVDLLQHRDILVQPKTSAW